MAALLSTAACPVPCSIRRFSRSKTTSRRESEYRVSRSKNLRIAEARHYRHTFRHRLLRTTHTRENSIAKSKRVLVPQRADQPAGIDRGRREPISPGPLIGRLASADAAMKSRGNVFQRQRIGLPSAVFERSVVPEADDSAMECSLERTKAQPIRPLVGPRHQGPQTAAAALWIGYACPCAKQPTARHEAARNLTKAGKQ
jgi:hypothetical protein